MPRSRVPWFLRPVHPVPVRPKPDDAEPCPECGATGQAKHPERDLVPGFSEAYTLCPECTALVTWKGCATIRKPYKRLDPAERRAHKLASQRAWNARQKQQKSIV